LYQYNLWYTSLSVGDPFVCRSEGTFRLAHELCVKLVLYQESLYLVSATSHKVSKHFLFFHNDAHNYNITGILKQLKFRRSLRHVSVHAGTIIREPFLCLAKTTVWFYILVDYYVVNVMAEFPSPPCTAHPHNKLVCCRDIDHVIIDEDIEPYCSFS
jgi:hypothetical protein